MTQDRREYYIQYNRIHKERKKFITRKYNYKIRLRVLALLGNKCIQCGFSDWRALQVDHINGRGSKENKISKGMLNNRLFKEISTGITKYQLLCANCNWIKRYENKEMYL